MTLLSSVEKRVVSPLSTEAFLLVTKQRWTYLHGVTSELDVKTDGFAGS